MLCLSTDPARHAVNLNFNKLITVDHAGHLSPVDQKAVMIT